MNTSRSAMRDSLRDAMRPVTHDARDGNARVWQRGPTVTRLAAAMLLVHGLMSASVLTAQEHVAANGAATTDDARAEEAMMQRKVTVTLDQVTVRHAIDVLAATAGVRAQYRLQLVDKVDKSVTLKATDISLRDALDRVLSGTDLRAVPVSGVLFAIVGPAASGSDALADGGIFGHVVDSKTKKSLAHVMVTLDNAKTGVVTNDEGVFRFAHVASGEHTLTVRLLGYGRVTQKVLVQDGQVVPVTVEIAAAATNLSTVVTTASGDRTRLTVGNDITVINADSVRQLNDIHSLSDLLATRVPGMVVQRSSGRVGSPDRIRIRGISSATLSNDPIIVVDGVRVEGLNSQNPGQTSRLDDIDPATVESIEVLKGPSASTLYGTDAANGVIVITTKRAQPGVTRWTADGTQRWTEVPGAFPPQFRGYGHSAESTDQVQCTLQNIASGACIQDSVVVGNRANNPNYTPSGTGTASNYGLSVTTGAQSVQAFLSGRVQDQLGAAQVPPAVADSIRILKGYVPSWFTHPNSQDAQYVQSNVTLQPSPKIDLGATLGGTHLLTTNSNGGDLSSYSNGLISDTLSVTLPSGLQHTTEEETHGRGALNGTVRPLAPLTLTGSFGADYGLTVNDVLQRSEDCISFCGGRADGTHNNIRTTTTVYSANTNGSFMFPLSALIRGTTGFGFQYQKTQADATTAIASGLAPGVTDISLGAVHNATTSTTAAATAGWFLEQRLSFGDRLFATGAFRQDAGSSFGRDIKAPIYPKFDASWLVLSEPPQIPLLNYLQSVRLRMAYGQSGVQPLPNGYQGLYQPLTALVDGTIVPATVLQQTGNADLKPERTGEFESGLDLESLNDRATLGFTYFQKRSQDAIITRNLGPSSGATTATRQENVGEVVNAGWELTGSVRPIDNDLLSWDISVNGGSTSNKLVSFGKNFVVYNPPANQGTNQRVAVGYPLFGYWARPLLAIQDLNGDGVIEANEVVFGDSATYAGWDQPKYQLNYTSNMSFWRGRVRFSATFQRIVGQTQYGSTLYSAGAIDANTPPALQALGQAGGSGMQVVDWTRWTNADLTVALPTKWIQRFHATAGTVSLTATNLGLWTNYRGRDPDVTSGYNGENVGDSGSLPATRDWALRFNLNF